MILKQLIIILVLFYYYKASNCGNPTKSAKSKGKPVHRHGSCKIIINEILFSSKGQSFFEIAKVCSAKSDENVSQELGGYAVLVYQKIADKFRCIQGTKLRNKILKNPELQPSVLLPESVDPSPHASRDIGAVREQHNHRIIQGKPQQQEGTLSSNQQNSNRNPASNSYPNSNFEKSPQMSVFSSRPKRDDLYKTQSNAKMFYSVDVPTLALFSEGSVVVLLLHIHSRQERGKLSCTVGETVTELEIAESKKWLYDMVVVSTEKNSENSEILKNFIKLLDPEINSNDMLRGVIIPHVQYDVSTGLEYSYSKCDDVSKPRVPNGFKLQPATKNNPNVCKLSAIFLLRPMCNYPFTFTGSNFKPQSNKLMLNLVASLEFYKNNDKIMKENSKQLAARLLNVAAASIYRAETKFKQNEIDVPPKKRKRTSEILEFMDDNNQKLLRRIITDFYGLNRVPTVPMLHTKFMEEARLRQLQIAEEQGPVPAGGKGDKLFHCSQESFRLLLHKLGYKFGALNHRYSVLFSPEKVRWRQRYIRRIQEIRKTGEKEIIYLDETWWDPNQLPKKGWIPKTCNDPLEKKEFSFKTVKPGRGPRYDGVTYTYLFGAGGGKFGFIPGSSRVWSIATKDADKNYHGNINAGIFETWFEELLTNIEKLSHRKFLIIMDNAQYHSVIQAPKQTARKQEIIEFLRSEQAKGLDVPENFETMLVVELKKVLQKMKKDNNYYKLDALTRSKGHEILRLPPYNCDMNPIEEVWKDIKYKLTHENENSPVSQQVESAKRALMFYEKQKWANHERHIWSIENSYIASDAKFDSALNHNPDIQFEEDIREENIDDDEFNDEIVDSESEDDIEYSDNVHVEESEPEDERKKPRMI